MGAASSVGVDPTALRKEYEAKAASAVSDEELLKHMKTLIIKAGKGDYSYRNILPHNTQDNTHTVWEEFRRRFPPKLLIGGAHTTKMAPLGRPHRDVSIDASLCVCTLPVVENIITAWKIVRGRVWYPACYTVR